MAAVVGILIFLVFLAAIVVGLVFWIMKIVEVCQIPEPQYRIAGTDKTVWVLVVILAGWIGALIWQFAKRDDVLRAAQAAQSIGAGFGGPGFGGPGFGGPGYGPGAPGYGPGAPGYGQPAGGQGYGPGPGPAPQAIDAPPPGWYPEPGTGWFAYWDGRGWTGARQPPQGQTQGQTQGQQGANLEKRPD